MQYEQTIYKLLRYLHEKVFIAHLVTVTIIYICICKQMHKKTQRAATGSWILFYLVHNTFINYLK